MLSRNVLSLKSSRALHITTVSNDFMSWFKRKQNKKVTTPERDTKEVINEIETGTSTIKTVSKGKLRLTEDDYIGKEIGELNIKERLQQMEQVPFNKWLSSNKVASSEELDKILLKSYNDSCTVSQVTTISDPKLSSPFGDLVSKFHFSKSLQALTGVMVPDYQLTRLTTPVAFREYYLNEVLTGKQARFKEAEPDAIHLGEESYSAASIYVTKDIGPKAQRKKLSQILAEVETLERDSARRAIEEARHSV